VRFRHLVESAVNGQLVRILAASRLHGGGRPDSTVPGGVADLAFDATFQRRVPRNVTTFVLGVA
jgi:hypothetical protein